jgi:hypothetical protein
MEHRSAAPVLRVSLTLQRRDMAQRASRRWSRKVTQRSDALDLQGGVFTWKDPKRIAASLKRSAQSSKRRKADPFRSALSMLTFYINRAGKSLPASRRRVLMRAKNELRSQFGRVTDRDRRSSGKRRADVPERRSVRAKAERSRGPRRRSRR